MFVVFTDQASTANIYTQKNVVSHACMLQNGCYSTKIKSAKIFLTVNPRKFIYTLEIYIPSK